MLENPSFKIYGSNNLEITPINFFHIPAVFEKRQKEEVVICGQIKTGGIVVGNKLRIVFSTNETIICSIFSILNNKKKYVQYTNASEEIFEISIQGVSIQKLKELNKISKPFIEVFESEKIKIVSVGHPTEFDFNFLRW